MSTVQVVGLSRQPDGLQGRKGTKYPVSDQVIDVAVMAGVYAVIGMLEVVLASFRGRRRGEDRGSWRRGSGTSPVMGPRQTEDFDVAGGGIRKPSGV